jgi:hypothetical protein
VDAILKEEEGALLWARGGLGSGHTCGGQVWAPVFLKTR